MWRVPKAYDMASAIDPQFYLYAEKTALPAPSLESMTYAAINRPGRSDCSGVPMMPFGFCRSSATRTRC